MKKRLLSLLLTLAMVIGTMNPVVLAAEVESHDHEVHVIVCNDTYTVSQGAPWSGTLVDTWVEINDQTTMMSAVADALEGYPAEGIETNYISSINELSEFDGGIMSGWMGTLNDWFTNEGFAAFTVANGTLEAGDEIRIMYTCSYGEDLGSSWSGNDNGVQSVEFSTGMVSPAFDSKTDSYELNLPKGTTSVQVTPTAINKNYQVRTYLGDTQYKRSAQIPVQQGSQIVVKCGDPSWPSMNSAPAKAAVYTFTVKLDDSTGEIPEETLPEETGTEEPEPQNVEPAFAIAANGAELLDGAIALTLGDSLKLEVVQTAGEAITPTYKWQKADGQDSALSNAGSASQRKKQSLSISTSSVGETWYACQVTYEWQGESKTITTDRVKVSVDLTQEKLESMLPEFEEELEDGTWYYGDAGNGDDDFGACLMTTIDSSAFDDSALVWYMSKDNGTSWEETSDFGTDPLEEMMPGAGAGLLALSELPVGQYQFKAVLTCSMNNLAGETLTASRSTNVANVTILKAKDFAGEGTAENPFLLSSNEDLAKLSENAKENKYSGIYFRFTKDLTLPADWTPIGISSCRFGGIIDGDNHLLTIPAGSKTLIGSPLGATLKNLNIYGSEIDGNGVVAYYTTGATGTAITIDNVTLKSGSRTSASGFVGGYASGSYVCNISNCTVEEGVVIGYDGTASNIGSFGGDFNGTITGCVSHATVKGVNFVGGISGSKGQSMGTYVIRNCSFDGQVIASGNYAGGISGSGYGGTTWGMASAPNSPCATIIDCEVNGSIVGADRVGGILGGEGAVYQCWNNGIGVMTGNRFTGKISATGTDAAVGAFAGFFAGINVNNQISGNSYNSDCGADKAFGKVAFVDTSAEVHETASGAQYINTSVSLPDFKAGTGRWDPNCFTVSNLNRTDDPLGADLESLVSCILVDVPLTIQEQPIDYQGNIGDQANFSIKASGNGLSYQWYYSKDGKKWSASSAEGAKSDTISIRLTAARSGQKYRCVVTDEKNQTVTSDIAAMSILTGGVEITSQPEDYAGNIGDNAVFKVAAAGEGLSYQWYYSKNGTDWSKSSMDGNKTDSLTVLVKAARYGQLYRCEVTDAQGGKATSEAAELMQKVAGIVITEQPASVTNGVLNKTYRFKVTAEGEGLTYQWYYSKNEGSSWSKSGMAGSDTASISVKLIEARNGQMYRCVIKDKEGNSVSSDAAILTK